MAREAICTRDKDGLNSANVGVKDSTRDLSSHVYVESWRDRVRVPQTHRTEGNERRSVITPRALATFGGAIVTMTGDGDWSTKHSTI